MSIDTMYEATDEDRGRLVLPKIDLSNMWIEEIPHKYQMYDMSVSLFTDVKIIFSVLKEKNGTFAQKIISPININDQINIFITKLTAQYPELTVLFFYDKEEDYYDIWHTNKELQFEDIKFRKFAGKLIKECFYSKNIFNFSFGYNYKEYVKNDDLELCTKNKIETIKVLYPYKDFHEEEFVVVEVDSIRYIVVGY